MTTPISDASIAILEQKLKGQTSQVVTSPETIRQIIARVKSERLATLEQCADLLFRAEITSNSAVSDQLKAIRASIYRLSKANGEQAS